MDAVKQTWTLDALCAEAERLLAADSPAERDGRVREVPDPRTVRYYTTLGLIDRPAMRGRTGYYGERHLLQLLAIKRLQAHGLPLAQVQARLLGLTTPELRKLVALPDRMFAREAEKEEKAEPRRDAESFWQTLPAPVAKATPTMQGVRIGEGVTLLVEATRPLREDDVTAINRAARSLVELLQTRGVIENRKAANGS